MLFGIVLLSSCGKTDQSSAIKDATLESRSVGNSCLEDKLPPDSGSCDHANISALIQIDMYPGCIFHVNQEYYLCTDLWLGHQNLFLGDFVIFDHDCDKYNEDSKNPTEAWEIAFNSQVWQVLTNYYLNNVIEPTTSVAEFEYIILQCSKTCYVALPPDPETGKFAIIPVKEQCGEECCERQTKYERDANGKFQPIGQSVSTITECPTTAYEDCPRRTVAETPCSSAACIGLQTF